MYWKRSDLLFLPVGGSEEIGMNANLYHYDDKWILVDFGISFPDETDLGIDVLLPDYEFIKSLGDKFLGIILTHGHEDHIGAIPYFANNINYTSGSLSTFKINVKRFLMTRQNIHFSMTPIGYQ